MNYPERIFPDQDNTRFVGTSVARELLNRGAHDDDSCFCRMETSLNSFNHKTGMSAFAKPSSSSKTQPRVLHAISPGPGQYDFVPRRTQERYKKAAGGVFHSRTKRGFQVAKDGPAPGQYENPLALRVDKQACGTQFRSKVIRDMGSSTNQTTTTPGPGTYDSDKAALFLHHDVISQARPSSMFRAPIPKQISAKPTANEETASPGPGSYYNPEASSSLSKMSEASSSSVFKSKTKRGLQRPRANPPGPAFYKPVAVFKKSHHLNAIKRWV